MDNENMEKESVFEEQVALAKAWTEACIRREAYPKKLAGDFDTFAESFANIPEYREPYDRLADEAEKLRVELYGKVTDKKGFVEKLKEVGENELADIVGRSFDAAVRLEQMRADDAEKKTGKPGKKSLISRIFKRENK